jgi:hypothetical protein
MRIKSFKGTHINLHRSTVVRFCNSVFLTGACSQLVLVHQIPANPNFETTMPSYGNSISPTKQGEVLP